MAARVAFPGTISSGDSVSATNNNKIPGGEIGYFNLTTNSSSTTSTAISVMSVSVTCGSSRQIRIYADVNLRGSAAGGAFAALYVDGTQCQRRNILIPASGTDTPVFLMSYVQPTAGAHTFDVYIGSSGGASVTCVNNGPAGTLGFSQLSVVDAGPAY